MFGSLGWPELLAILAIVLIIFGVGRISKIAGEMGSGIRAFKQGLQGDDEKKPPAELEDKSETGPDQNKS